MARLKNDEELRQQARDFIEAFIKVNSCCEEFNTPWMEEQVFNTFKITQDLLEMNSIHFGNRIGSGYVHLYKDAGFEVECSEGLKQRVLDCNVKLRIPDLEFGPDGEPKFEFVEGDEIVAQDQSTGEEIVMKGYDCFEDKLHSTSIQIISREEGDGLVFKRPVEELPDPSRCVPGQTYVNLKNKTYICTSEYEWKEVNSVEIYAPPDFELTEDEQKGTMIEFGDSVSEEKVEEAVEKVLNTKDSESRGWRVPSLVEQAKWIEIEFKLQEDRIKEEQAAIEVDLAHFPDTCSACGAPAYRGVTAAECSKNCGGHV